jgi:hypothetical protein
MRQAFFGCLIRTQRVEKDRVVLPRLDPPRRILPAVMDSFDLILHRMGQGAGSMEIRSEAVWSPGLVHRAMARLVPHSPAPLSFDRRHLSPVAARSGMQPVAALVERKEV